MKKALANSNEAVRSLIAGVLRAFVGRGKPISFATLAAETGEKAGTLYSYEAPGGPCMPTPVLFRVCAALPLDARGRILRALAGPPAPVPAMSVRSGVTGIAKFEADAVRDCEKGEPDHRQRAVLAREAERIAPFVDELAREAAR